MLLLLCSFWLIVEKTGVGNKSNTGDKASLRGPAAELLLTAPKVFGFPSRHVLHRVREEVPKMPQVEENVCAVPPNGERGEEQSDNSPAPPKMFKIVKMCRLRWQVLLVEAPEGQRYPFGLERCLSVNAIKKPSQQLKSPRRWSALLPSSPKDKVLECACNPVAGDPPAVCPCPAGGDGEDAVSPLGSEGSSCCETRTSRPLLRSAERCPKHDGPLGGPHPGPLCAAQELVSSTGDHGDVAQADPVPRKQCYSGSNSLPKAKKAASSEQRVQTPVQQQRLAKRDSLHTALPLSSKIKLLSKDNLTAMKAKTAFSELKTVQTFSNKKCPKCPFCYQHHE